MPELPEVEIIRRGLQKYLVGHQIIDISVLDPKIFAGDVRNVTGSTVQEIQRIGKGLIIVLDNGYSLAIHVKMTGQLIYKGPRTKNISISQKVGIELPNKFTRIIFSLDKKATLFYNDIRRFGWIKVLRTEDVLALPFFSAMGPEPFKDLTLEYFSTLLSINKTPIKTLLMDQKKIGGIGNIYANDALWESRIDPRRPASSLGSEEVKTLFKSVHQVMEFSIEHGAASDSSYVDALGQDGRYQEHFKVYGRDGQNCDRCGTEIERIKLGGRGTFFCPRCQT